jgi:hypothetical protein
MSKPLTPEQVSAAMRFYAITFALPGKPKPIDPVSVPGAPTPQPTGNNQPKDHP